MSREATDQLYIELGYYYPEEYYTYQAEAAAAIASSATVSCDAQKLGAPIEAAADLNSTVSQTAVADRFASFDIDLTASADQTAACGLIFSAVADFQGVFTPSLTAIAYKNHTAALDSLFDFTTIPSINRSITTALDYAAALDAQAAITADASSSMAAQATQTTSANSTKPFSATLSSSFTQSATIYSPVFAAAALSSDARLFTSRYFGYYRPVTSTLSGTYQFVTDGENIGNSQIASVKYGTHALFLSNGAAVTTEASNDFMIGANDEFSVEFWWMQTGSHLASAQPVLAKVGVSTTATMNSLGNQDHWAIGIDSNDYLQFKYRISGTTFGTITTTTNSGAYSLTHLAVKRGSDGIIRFYKNNTQIGSTSYSGAFAVPSTANYRTIVIKNNGIYLPGTSGYGIIFDEFSYRIGSSTVSGYSSVIANAPPTQKILLHFDNNVSDDISFQGTLASNIAGSATLTAAARANLGASSAQSTTASISIVAGVIKPAASDLSSTASTTATAYRTQPASSDLAATVDLTATAYRIQTANSDLAGEFALTADLIRIQDTSADLSVTASISLISDITRDITLDIAAAFTESADAERYRSIDSALDSTADQTAAFDRSRDTASALELSASMTIDAYKYTPLASDLTVTAGIEIQASKTVDAIIEDISLFGVSFSAVAILRPEVYLETAATMSTVIGVIKQFATELPLRGLEFNNNGTVDVGDDFILYENFNINGYSTQENQWLISFWARDALGTVLSHNPTALSTVQGRITFTVSGLDIYAPCAPGFDYSSYRRVQYQLDTQGWHHYLIYNPGDESPNSPPTSSTTNLRLWQDGVEITAPTVTTYNAPNQPTAPTDDWLNLWNSIVPLSDVDQKFKWALGARLRYWGTGSSIWDKAYDLQPAQGQYQQFVAYWSSATPDATQSSVRSKLYNDGQVDLGLTGTQTGLAQPQIYVRAQSYQDYQNRGSLTSSAPQSSRWKTITDTSYNSPDDNNNWILTADSQPSSANFQGSGLFVDAELSAKIIGVFLFVTNLSSTTSMTVTATKFKGSDIDLSSETTLTAEAVKTTDQQLTLTSQAEVTADVERYRQGVATLENTADLAADVNSYTDFSLAFALEAQITADVDLIPPIRASADLSSSADLSATAYKIQPEAVAVAARFDLNCEATLIPPVRIEADLTVSAALTVIIGRQTPAAASLAAETTIVTPAVKTTDTASDQTVTSEITAAPVNIIGIVATLNAGVFQLTAGDVINIDPFLTLTVTEETRTIVIYQETRTLTVDQESRILTLGGY